MCLLISVFKTCFSQFGQTAFFSSPRCSILMCLLQLDWWENIFPQDKHSKFLSSCFWQSWLAPSRRAAASNKIYVQFSNQVLRHIYFNKLSFCHLLIWNIEYRKISKLGLGTGHDIAFPGDFSFFFSEVLYCSMGISASLPSLPNVQV